MVDARIVRTRAALHSAILELAQGKPAPEITVSELANLAGINRVTFYKHFTTPSDTLASALGLELDPAREQFLGEAADTGIDPRVALANAISRVLDQIEARSNLYRLSIDTRQDGAVPNLLADHFTETLRRCFEIRDDVYPDHGDIDREVVARFFGTGLVGAIKAWLLSGAKNRQHFLDSVMSLVPAWWFPEQS